MRRKMKSGVTMFNKAVTMEIFKIDIPLLIMVCENGA